MLPAEFCSIVDGATVVMGGIDGGGGIGYPPDAIFENMTIGVEWNHCEESVLRNLFNRKNFPSAVTTARSGFHPNDARSAVFRRLRP